MAAEPWQIVALACAAVGLAAWAARMWLAAAGSVQTRRLAREGGALRRWWEVLGELPPDVLTPTLRTTLGRILSARLERALRGHADHPFLTGQRREVERFAAGAPVGPASGGAAAGGTVALRTRIRQRQLAALRELLGLLRACAGKRLVAPAELDCAEGIVAQAIAEMELLRSQPSQLGPDRLRRMTRAIGGAGLPLPSAQSSRAFPTQ